MPPRIATSLFSLALVASCTIEDRPPPGSRPDDSDIRATVTRYYNGVTARARAETRRDLWDSVLVVRAERGNWYAIRGADAWTDSLTVRAHFLTDPAEAEPLRIEIRQQGDVAAAWVTLRGATGSRIEHVVLTRDADRWRIVTVASAPLRSAS